MYRIVHNEQTDTYRIEKKGFFGWNFVSDPHNGDYLQFASLSSARRWVQSTSKRSIPNARRWQVVSDCSH